MTKTPTTRPDQIPVSVTGWGSGATTVDGATTVGAVGPESSPHPAAISAKQKMIAQRALLLFSISRSMPSSSRRRRSPHS